MGDGALVLSLQPTEDRQHTMDGRSDEEFPAIKLSLAACHSIRLPESRRWLDYWKKS